MLDGYGTRIRTARNAAGFSQDKLSKLAQVSKKTISRWETEENSPPPSAWSHIGIILGVRTEWLSTGQGQMVGTPIRQLLMYREMAQVDLVQAQYGLANAERSGNMDQIIFSKALIAKNHVELASFKEVQDVFDWIKTQPDSLDLMKIGMEDLKKIQAERKTSGQCKNDVTQVSPQVIDQTQNSELIKKLDDIRTKTNNMVGRIQVKFIIDSLQRLANTVPDITFDEINQISNAFNQFLDTVKAIKSESQIDRNE